MLRVRLLGDFAVQVDGREVADAAWRRRKARTLVKLLALAPGHVLHRDELIEAMWPDAASGANNLHQALFAARRAVQAEAYLQLRDERLVLGEPVIVDADEFEAAAELAERTGRPDHVRAAIAGYGGELLPGDRYEPWSEPRRTELRRRHHGLVAELAAAQVNAGDREAALALLQPVHTAEPLDEGIARLLIRTQLAADRRSVAVATYHQLVESLRDELGVAPAAETQELGRELAARPEHGPVTTPHNLPLRLSSFIGRERELTDVRAMLRHTRLLTLTGTGGCGKTRLAIELAELLLEEYPGGVHLVELAPLSTSDAVPRALAATLGVQQTPDVDPTAAIAHRIKRQLLPMLLVVDNCEHLVDAAAALAHQLLTNAPNLTVLATSRQPLLVPGEVVWRVPSLTLPDGSAAPERYESVRLLLERAAAAAPGFALRDGNAADVITLCRRLDGLPLALELAAARLRTLPLSELVARLDDRFTLLVGGSRIGLTRQQTLRATVDWSHDLLAEPERVLLRRLAVFAGGFTLAAAEAVCPDERLDRGSVAELLTGLVDRSLVTAVEGAARYRLLETIREYAVERLTGSGETGRLRDRHAAWVLDLAAQAEPELAHTGRPDAFRRLAIEDGNLRAALSWLQRTDPGAALRLAGLMWRYWFRSGRLTEGLQALHRAVNASSGATPDRARALLGVCGLTNRAGRIGGWDVHAAERVRIFTELGDPAGVSRAQFYLGVQAWLTQEFERSHAAFDTALAVATEHDLPAHTAAARFGIAAIASVQGRPADAEPVLADVLDRVQQLSGEPVPVFNVMPIPRHEPGRDPRHVVFEETATSFLEPTGPLAVGHVIANLGSIAREAGDHELARERYERALAIFENADDDAGIALTLSRLGNLAGATHEMARAQAQLEAALRMFRRTRDARSIGQTIANLGYVIAMSGDLGRGRAMVERSEAMFREHGDRPGLFAALSHLGALALIAGDVPAARRAFAEEVEVERSIDAPIHLAWALVDLAEATHRAGEDPTPFLDEARALFASAGRADGLAAVSQL